MWLFGTHAYSTVDMSLSLLHYYFGQKNHFNDDGGTVRIDFDLNSGTNPGDNTPLDKDNFSFCGLGLEIHETPRVGASSTGKLKAGHVVTVEPGLYYPEIGGVRLEDVALVTGNGAKNLTRFEKVLEL